MVTMRMGTPSAVPKVPEGAVLRTLKALPLTTAAPATSLAPPKSATPWTAPSNVGLGATAATPVTIGFGSVSVTVNWMVPPAGAVWSRTFSETPANGGSVPPEPSSSRPARQHTATTRECLTTGTRTRLRRLRYVMGVTSCLFFHFAGRGGRIATRKRWISDLAIVLPEASLASTFHRSALPGTIRARTAGGSDRLDLLDSPFHSSTRSTSISWTEYVAASGAGCHRSSVGASSRSPVGP